MNKEDMKQVEWKFLGGWVKSNYMIINLNVYRLIATCKRQRCSWWKKLDPVIWKHTLLNMKTKIGKSKRIQSNTSQKKTEVTILMSE